MQFDANAAEIAALVKRLLDDAYAQGRKDAIDALVRAANVATVRGEAATIETKNKPETPSNEELKQSENDFSSRKRAPRGSTERVIRRAITNAHSAGVTISDIMRARDDELEMMLAESSIR
ncbi:MAG: hypothetical protein ACRCWO_01130, partial [Bosea sp. (in: a-proteobacteria)]